MAETRREYIAQNTCEEIVARFDGERFALTKKNRASFPHIPARNVIILNPKEAQQFASFVFRNLPGNIWEDITPEDIIRMEQER